MYPHDDSNHPQLNPGRILLLYCDFIEPHPKNKYLVLIKMFPTPIFFFINSRRSDFSDGIVILKCERYSFLKYDSYMDCSKILQHFIAAEIHRQIEADTGRIKEQLDRSDVDALLEAVSKSRQLSELQKTMIMETF